MTQNMESRKHPTGRVLSARSFWNTLWAFGSLKFSILLPEMCFAHSSKWCTISCGPESNLIPCSLQLRQKVGAAQEKSRLEVWKTETDFINSHFKTLRELLVKHTDLHPEGMYLYLFDENQHRSISTNIIHYKMYTYCSSILPWYWYIASHVLACILVCFDKYQHVFAYDCTDFRSWVTHLCIDFNKYFAHVGMKWWVFVSMCIFILKPTKHIRIFHYVALHTTFNVQQAAFTGLSEPSLVWVVSVKPFWQLNLNYVLNMSSMTWIWQNQLPCYSVAAVFND